MHQSLSIAETAAIVGKSKVTLAVWRHRGQNLPYYKLGRVIRYRKADVEELAAGHMAGYKRQEPKMLTRQYV